MDKTHEGWYLYKAANFNRFALGKVIKECMTLI